MPKRRVNQRLIERLESLTREQRREVQTFVDRLAPPAARAKSGAAIPQRPRRRKTPGQLFWERLVNEGLYDGDGRRLEDEAISGAE
jgi:hypothetical protein